MSGRQMRHETATLTPEEILAAHDGALLYCSEAFGTTVNAKSTDLRLWTAAAIIQSCKEVSIPAEIMASLETKLAFLEKMA